MDSSLGFINDHLQTSAKLPQIHVYNQIRQPTGAFV